MQCNIAAGSCWCLHQGTVPWSNASRLAYTAVQNMRTWQAVRLHAAGGALRPHSQAPGDWTAPGLLAGRGRDASAGGRPPSGSPAGQSSSCSRAAYLVATHSELRLLVWTLWAWCSMTVMLLQTIGRCIACRCNRRCASSLSNAEPKLLMQAGPGLKCQTRSLPKRQAGVYISSAAEPEENGQPREVATAPQVGPCSSLPLYAALFCLG